MGSTPFSISANSRRIDPTRHRPDGSSANNDRTEIGPTPLAFAEWAESSLEVPHLPTMREYRLGRLVQQLQARDLAGILLFDPLNIRYATDTTNMQLWTTHNPARACFVSAGGHVVLWDFHGCDHLSAHLPLVSELRSGASFSSSKRAIAPISMPSVLLGKWTNSYARTGAPIVGWLLIASRLPAFGHLMLSAWRFAAAKR